MKESAGSNRQPSAKDRTQKSHTKLRRQSEEQGW